MKSVCCKWLQPTLYALRMAVRHWACIRRVYQHATPLSRITALDPLSLTVQGIAVLVLDFDGVLAAEGAFYPSPKVQQWLDHGIRQFGSERVFILSNQPHPERIAWFAQQYPGVRWISGVRKKPYPDGLLAIQQQTGVPAQAIVLIDDRLLTGVLAACIAQTQVLYIRNPYVNWSGKLFREVFFWLLRSLEKGVFRL